MAEEPQQEDGVYHRVNSSMIMGGKHSNQIVSLLGQTESTDGSYVSLRCADGGNIRVKVNPDFDFKQGNMVEIIGAVHEDFTLECFVVREMGNDFDLELYNEMIMKIQQNIRFREYFQTATQIQYMDRTGQMQQ